ncbi:MAG: UDP-glucose/GDP-mannose dehydrogenase family protein [Alphaproteobacteria bacterium]|nr:UDP-glucose/GDP-mannose dehydrogenase family protein [Alphaproteobacteria bacterium]
MNVLANTAQFQHQFPVPRQGEGSSKISVIGLGYVGAVSMACLSSLGHRVVGVDVDPVKTEMIADGRSPIHEKNLEELLSTGVADELITTTGDISDAVLKTDVTFVSVGTPTAPDGGCDFKYIRAAARAIGEGLSRKQSYHVVVMRCSVPPASTLSVMVPEIEKASGKSMGDDFGICFNPEFLREGTAVADFNAPPKTVIGANDWFAAEIVADIYRPVDANPIMTTIEVAEMVKYVDNVWHATKVCFANEVGRVCKPLGVDSHAVMDIFVEDTKLNLSPYYLKPGFAYGGSCLPKEVRAVVHLAEQVGVDTPLFSSLAATNNKQIEAAVDLIRLSGAKRVGFLGLAFKAGTDDLRESPILEVMNRLIEDGCDVTAYDPAIKPDTRVGNQFEYVRNVCPHLEPTVSALPELLRHQGVSVIDESDVVVVTQNTPEIRQIVAARLERAKIIDLVRLFKVTPTFENYEGIGW